VTQGEDDGFPPLTPEQAKRFMEILLDESVLIDEEEVTACPTDDAMASPSFLVSNLSPVPPR